jgi:hypothetical protein
MVPTALPHPLSSHRHDHAVGFYETDGFLVELIAGFVAPALDDDETAFVIANAEHQGRLLEALRSRYPDVEVALRTGQLVLVDADTTRWRLLTDGRLDPARFRRMATEMFAHVAERGRPVRIFGYMVARFWEEGNTTAALALEDQWNELAETYDFELMCAYPMSSFAGTGSDDAFRTVCERHSAIANEGYAHLGSDPGDRLRDTASVVVLQREPDWGPDA